MFGLPIGVLGAVSFTLVALLAMLLGGEISDGALTIAALYVFVYCSVSGVVTFLLSAIVKAFRKNKMPKWEGYFFLLIVALPINLYLLAASPLLELVVSLASTITIYLGEKIYRKVWDKIGQLFLSNKKSENL